MKKIIFLVLFILSQYSYADIYKDKILIYIENSIENFELNEDGRTNLKELNDEMDRVDADRIDQWVVRAIHLLLARAQMLKGIFHILVRQLVSHCPFLRPSHLKQMRSIRKPHPELPGQTSLGMLEHLPQLGPKEEYFDFVIRREFCENIQVK